ncbi:MAG: hypothetical protein KatS3mg042_0662 [Rhodothermaceae bacterium]|nr:MAG: hypothetical protein KatS3mg042_0662 [Rhodothermaceae bacterium]
MPFKRPGSPYYYINRTLPGFGRTGWISTRVRDKGVARRMEALLVTLAERALVDDSYRDLLVAVRDRHISLPDLLAAHSRGRLDDLRRTLRDPLLSDAVQDYRAAARYEKGTWEGLDILAGLVPAGARLSEIASGKAVMGLCARAEAEGRRRNSVRRTLLRAISKLLRYHLGRAERDHVFADVHYAAEDDTREVHLTPEEVRRLVETADALYPEMGLVIRLALQTSADRGTLLAGRHGRKHHRGLLVSDLRIYQEGDRYTGEVTIHDTKTAHRTRTMPLTDHLCRLMLAQCARRRPDDPVFDTTYQQMDFRWQRIREAANLAGLRFKDLRHQTAIAGEMAGIPLTTLQRALGHDDARMTRRYQQRQTALSPDEAERLEQVLYGRTG